MAIPIGTTSRQLGALVRWMYVGVVVLGMLTCWWPSYRGWGAVVGGLLVALVLWLCWQTLTISRTVWGHPVYVVFLIPAAVLTYHLTRTGMAAQIEGAEGLGGAINLSMILHLAMLGLAVMLSQGLLPKAVGHVSVVSICGGAMMISAIVPILLDEVRPVHSALAMVGFVGVAVWLSPLWHGSLAALPPGLQAARHRELRWACLAVAAVAGGILAWACPGEAVLVAGAAAVTFLVAGLVLPRRRRGSLIIWAALVALATAVLGMGFGPPWLGKWAPWCGWLGRGEAAFADVGAGDDGLAILAQTVGWPAASLVVAGLATCLVMFLLRAGRGHAGDQAQAIVWCLASLFSVCAMLSPGGLFVPAVTLAVGFTWGLMPAVAGRPVQPRSGAVILVILVAVMLLLGVSRSGGLVFWAAKSFWTDRMTDKFLHWCVGLILAMVMAWLMGSRTFWWGLVGIVLAALAGGLGELLQCITITRRTVEYADWAVHAIGSAVALIPYTLCIGARLCESVDAYAPQDDAGRGYYFI